MKKLFVIFLCLCALSCSKDNDIDIQIDSQWADQYPWLETIMIKAEKGEFKAANGKPALITIYVLEVNEEHYFFFNYGKSGGLLYDEIRDCNGNVIEKLDYYNYPGELIYPFF